MSLAYVIPTRDRPDVLSATLAALGSLPRHDGHVIVVDNASAARPTLPRTLANGLGVELIPLRSNAGAAARNAAAVASDPACEWLVMLDDDSAPMWLGHLEALAAAGPEVAAVAAEIWLPSVKPAEPNPLDAATLNAVPARSPALRTRREAGGLPEVFIGCGVAIRRAAFLDAGGYDHTFNFYAEEYDLAAKLLRAGGRVVLDRRFQVMHRKVASGRDMNVILERLVRNNGWVMQRYAPARRRISELRRVIDRYGEIARRERAEPGYVHGRRELLSTLRAQHRTPLPTPLWDRFTGKSVARASLERAWIRRGFRTAAIIDEGKNAHVIREVLRELGVREVPTSEANTLVIGTLSPGPMLDAFDRRAAADARVIAAWDDLAAPKSAAKCA